MKRSITDFREIEKCAGAVPLTRIWPYKGNYYWSLEDAGYEYHPLTPLQVVQHCTEPIVRELSKWYQNQLWELQEGNHVYQTVYFNWYPLGRGPELPYLRGGINYEYLRHSVERTIEKVMTTLIYKYLRQEFDAWWEVWTEPFNLTAFFEWCGDRWMSDIPGNRFYCEINFDPRAPQDEMVRENLADPSWMEKGYNGEIHGHRPGNAWKVTVHERYYPEVFTELDRRIARKRGEGYFPWGIFEHLIKIGDGAPGGGLITK